MASSAPAAAEGVPFIGVSSPEGSHSNTPLGPLSKDIFPYILNLYSGGAKKADFDIYVSDATFEDPLMRAQGVPQIKSAFYSLGRFFSVSRMVEWNINEKESSTGSGEISISNKQHYKIVGRDFDMESTVILEVKDGKVVKHEDRWNHKPFAKSTKFLPRGNMLLTHMLMGFGKDR